MFDAIQIVLAGALRGAGDTWYVLFGSLATIVSWLTLGLFGERLAADALYWWWWMLTGWICSLSIVMMVRFARGKWTERRMVDMPTDGESPPDRLS